MRTTAETQEPARPDRARLSGATGRDLRSTSRTTRRRRRPLYDAFSTQMPQRPSGEKNRLAAFIPGSSVADGWSTIEAWSDRQTRCHATREFRSNLTELNVGRPDRRVTSRAEVDVESRRTGQRAGTVTPWAHGTSSRVPKTAASHPSVDGVAVWLAVPLVVSARINVAQPAAWILSAFEARARGGAVSAAGLDRGESTASQLNSRRRSPFATRRRMPRCGALVHRFATPARVPYRRRCRESFPAAWHIVVSGA